MLLTATVFVPLIGALALLAVPRRASGAARVLALTASLVTLGLAVALAVRFDPGAPGFQLGQDVPWLESLGVSYRVGVDGISLPLLLLTAVLTPLAILGAWRVQDRPRAYLGLVLVLQSALLGVFSALDLLLFYVFWEAVLIPAYLLVGGWGGPDRVRATMRFFLYTLLGGLVMLVAILGLYALQAGVGTATFDYEVLRDLPKDAVDQRWLLLGFLVAFAIKTPLFPLHSWLPDTYTQAHPTTTLLLSGVLAKMGVYAMIRIALPVLPDAAQEFAPALLVLATVSILYAALVALAQRDAKRMLAYSSMSHMGFMVLGVFALNAQGVQGAVFYMVAHGLVTGGLFLLLGMVEERTGTRDMTALGGLQGTLPRMAAVMLVLTLASAAVPGLVGFVGEFLTLLGAFQANAAVGAVATVGVILGAVYLLWAYQRIWHGQAPEGTKPPTRDLSVREWVVVAPLLAAVLVLGVAPAPVLDRIAPAVERTIAQFDRAPTEAAP